MKKCDIQRVIFLTDYIQKCHQKAEKYDRLNFSRGLIILKLFLFHIKLFFQLFSRAHSIYPDPICHILLKPAAGVGDHCHFLKYAFALKKRFKNQIRIDVVLEKKDAFLKDTLYRYTPFIHQIFIGKAPRHDCEIRVVRFPQIEFWDDHRMKNLSVELNAYFQGLLNFACHNPNALISDYLGRCFAKIMNLIRENQADLRHDLKMDQIDDFRIKIDLQNQGKILKKFGLYHQKFIILQTGAGAHFQKAVKDMRQWPLSNYEKLVCLLKAKFPNYKLVQCGAQGQPVIPNVDLNLVGKTSFAEVLILLQQADLLISQEGGYPILRHYLSRKKSCVIFGPTDLDFFGFPENINLSQRKCEGCEWINNHWYQRCIKMSDHCINMIGPKEVISHLK